MLEFLCVPRRIGIAARHQEPENLSTFRVPSLDLKQLKGESRPFKLTAARRRRKLSRPVAVVGLEVGQLQVYLGDRRLVRVQSAPMSQASKRRGLPARS